RASSWTTISYTSVTVQGAHGFWLAGATMTTVSFSSAQANSGSSYPLYVNGASANTFTAFLANNLAGYSVYLDTGANPNTLSQSAVVSNVPGYAALRLVNNSYNTI